MNSLQKKILFKILIYGTAAVYFYNIDFLVLRTSYVVAKRRLESMVKAKDYRFMHLSQNTEVAVAVFPSHIQIFKGLHKNSATSPFDECLEGSRRASFLKYSAFSFGSYTPRAFNARHLNRERAFIFRAGVQALKKILLLNCGAELIFVIIYASDSAQCHII